MESHRNYVSNVPIQYPEHCKYKLNFKTTFKFLEYISLIFKEQEMNFPIIQRGTEEGNDLFRVTQQVIGRSIPKSILKKKHVQRWLASVT